VNLTGRIQNPYLRNLVEWLLVIAVAVVFFVAMRFFIFRLAHVDGISMEPTLKHRDLVVLSRITYILGNPKQGDIVAFPYSENPSEHYIKRVIGVPGDVIDIVGGQFTVNGVPLVDAFANDSIYIFGDVAFPTPPIQDGYYFLLGDNRNGSKDSRYTSVGYDGYGCVPKNKIVGKVVIRLWPLNRFGAAR
jgi:signal peptidase I